MNYACEHYLLSKTRTYEHNRKEKWKFQMTLTKKTHQKNKINPRFHHLRSGGGGGIGP